MAEAITVLLTISGAKSKPNAYFVNLTLSFIQGSRDIEAEHVAREGLAAYPDDPDLLGNLTLALSGQKRYAEAEAIAKRRLNFGRNVHSLEELAIVQLPVLAGAVLSQSRFRHFWLLSLWRTPPK